MKAVNRKKPLRKDRTMTMVSLRVPEDMVEDLKRIAPIVGFGGYQPLMRHYVGEGLRHDLERLDETPLSGLVDSLKRRGVDEQVIADAVAEVRGIG